MTKNEATNDKEAKMSQPLVCKCSGNETGCEHSEFCPMYDDSMNVCDLYACLDDPHYVKDCPKNIRSEAR